MVYVPPKYPGEIPTIEDLPNRQDDVHWIKAARYNELKKELRAALTELGVLPKGSYADVKTRLDDIQKQSGCRVWRAGTLEVPHNTWTKITFNYRSWDKDNEFDHITNHRFIAKRAGLYLAIANVAWLTADVEADLKWRIRIDKNAVPEVIGGVHSSVADTLLHMSASTIIDMVVGQYLEVQVLQVTGNTIELDLDNWDTNFTVAKISLQI